MAVEIIFARQEHLEQVQKLWGLNRATLGFMPKDAFRDAVQKKWILAALTDNFVVGYLQFRYTARTQTLAIVHLCVDTSFRSQKIAEQLLDRLVDEFKSSARGIKLNCRSDYQEAIAFWRKYNFQPKGKLPSRGSNQNVHLITWWYSFGRQDLFSIIKSDKINAVLDVNIIAKLMDIHLADVIKDEIAQLQSDWLATEVEYYQTSETTSEIHRDTDAARNERSKRFLKDFPELNIDKPSIKAVELQLSAVYSGISDNDRSDRRQVAETILSGFPYFITLDDGLLKHAGSISEKYGLKIVTPSTLISEIDMSINAEDYYPHKLPANNFTISKVSPADRDGILGVFLNHGAGEKKNEFNSTLNELIARPSGCVKVIREGEKMVALFGIYEAGDFFYVPMLRTKQYSLRQTIFMQNVEDLVRTAITAGKEFVLIQELYLTGTEKDILLSSGFFPHENCFIKGIKSGIYAAKNIKAELADISLKIPALNELIEAVHDSAGAGSYLDAVSLEKLLWPLKILDADVPCFIIPIKPFYAKQLFDTHEATADLFGVEASLIWSKENVYYRNAVPNVEKFPARILWYASSSKHSNRQQAIVCSSYLSEVIIGSAKELFKKHEKFGVYTWKRDISPLVKGEVEKQIKVLRFSDSECFPTAVSLKAIKKLLAKYRESDNNFQCPLQIKTATFMELYALGKGLAIDHG